MRGISFTANFLADRLVGGEDSDWRGEILVVKTLVSNHRVLNFTPEDLDLLPDLLRRYITPPLSSHAPFSHFCHVSGRPAFHQLSTNDRMSISLFHLVSFFFSTWLLYGSEIQHLLYPYPPFFASFVSMPRNADVLTSTSSKCFCLLYGQLLIKLSAEELYLCPEILSLIVESCSWTTLVALSHVDTRCRDIVHRFLYSRVLENLQRFIPRAQVPALLDIINDLHCALVGPVVRCIMDIGLHLENDMLPSQLDIITPCNPVRINALLVKLFLYFGYIVDAKESITFDFTEVPSCRNFQLLISVSTTFAVPPSKRVVILFRRKTKLCAWAYSRVGILAAFSPLWLCARRALPCSL